MKLIYLLGNMCSGKTTLARNICEVLPHYQQFEIDEYRRRYQAVTLEKEEKAWAELMHDLAQCPYAILDTTGVGYRAMAILQQFQAQPGMAVLTIRLEVPELVARSRFDQRIREGYQEPPFAYNTTRWESFMRIGEKLNLHPVAHTIDTHTFNEEQVLAMVLDILVEADFI